MLKLSKKQYKTLLEEFLASPYHKSLKVYIDFNNELLYFLNPETDLIWYTEGSLTELRKDKGWTLLPKSLLKQANKVILQDKHFIHIEPEENLLGAMDGDYQAVLSMFDGNSAGRYALELNEAYGSNQDNRVFPEKLFQKSEPKQAVCAVIARSSPFNGVTFLGVSRKDNQTDFGLPGGKVEEGEGLYDALFREVLEETGYTLTDTVLEVFRNIDEDGYEVISLIATVDLSVPKTPVTPNETGVVRWVTAEQLMQGSFGEYNRQLFDALGFLNDSN